MHEMPLIDRNPTDLETRTLQLFLSFFGNGMGWENEKDGTTRIGWRQIERVLSYFYSGQMHKEDKDVFDIISNTWDENEEKIGISVKSKLLEGPSQFFGKNPTDTRLYLELSNSHAKFWEELKKNHINNTDFGKSQYAQKIGNLILTLVRKWHSERFELDRNIIENRSRYLVVSFSAFSKQDHRRQCAIHSFSLDLPDADWKFHSKKCLRGYCKETGNHIWDWYGESGGQLKFYPDASNALWSSKTFPLIESKGAPFIELIEEQFGPQGEILNDLCQRQRELLER